MVRLKSVDQLVGEVLDPRFQSLDLARKKGGTNEISEAAMHRWLKFEEGLFFELIEGGEVGWRFGPAEFLAGGEVENLATKAAVAQEGGDILVRGKTPMAELLPKNTGLSRRRVL